MMPEAATGVENHSLKKAASNYDDDEMEEILTSSDLPVSDTITLELEETTLEINSDVNLHENEDEEEWNKALSQPQQESIVAGNTEIEVPVNEETNNNRILNNISRSTNRFGFALKSLTTDLDTRFQISTKATNADQRFGITDSVTRSTRALGHALNNNVREPVGKALQPVGRSFQSGGAVNQTFSNANRSIRNLNENLRIGERSSNAALSSRQWFSRKSVSLGWGKGEEIVVDEGPSYGTSQTSTPESSPSKSDRQNKKLEIADTDENKKEVFL